MKDEIKVFFTAIMFYTRIPCPNWVDHSEDYINRSIRYFPLIGWIVASVSIIPLFIGATYLSSAFGVVMYLIAGVFVTGAFHEDGFADMCDGFGGGWTKTKILEIMKDSRVGTYGVLGLIFLLLTKVILLLELVENLVPIVYIITCGVAHSLSRFITATMIFTHDYIRDAHDSKAKPVSKSMTSNNLLISSLFGLLPLMFISWYLHNYFFMLLLPFAYLIKAFMGRYFKKWIGGYTGDCLGATQQTVEVFTYLGFVLIWRFM